MGMDAAELARWTRFAGKGGIGNCVAICDCVAESSQDLMFLKDDEIIVLMQLKEENLFLGYCEGVVGRFHGADVRFLSKLKKPIMTKRSSVAASVGAKSPTPSSGLVSPVPGPSNSFELNSVHRPDSTRPVSTVPHIPLMPSPSLPSTDDEKTSPLSAVYSSSSTISEPPQTNSLPSRFEDQLNHPQAPPDLPPGPITASFSQERESLLPPAAVQSRLSPIPSSITPLQITKRASPIPPTLPTPPATTLQLPDASYSMEEPSGRISLALSDGEVGIGLSLLQDLADEMGSDEEDNWSKSSRYSVQTPDVVANLHEQERPESRQSTEGDRTFTHIDMYDGNGKPLVPPGLGSSPEPMSPPAPQDSPVQSLRSPPISPSSPSFGNLPHPNALFARPASLAPSAGSGSSWDGAADIYDDYRYSRMSMASKFSRMSQGTIGGMSVRDAYAPPVPDSRPSVDSRSSIDSHARPRLDSSSSNRQRPLEVQGQGVSSTQPLGLDRRRKDSAASVYTQSSKVSSTRSGGKSLLSAPPSPLAPDLSIETAGTSRPRLAIDVSPEPSPLLHTTWGSSTSTTSPTSLTSPTSILSPRLGPSGSGGVASALRQKIETDRLAVLPVPIIDEVHVNDGPGGGIVVEDDEELPSRIEEDSKVLDDSRDFTESPSRELYDSPSPSSSPEPEAAFMKPVGLTIANRTPEPSDEGERTEEKKWMPEPSSPLVPSSPPFDHTTSTDTMPEIDASMVPPSSTSTSSNQEIDEPKPRLRHQHRQSALIVPNDRQRRSIFLPHPNAPKVPAVMPEQQQQHSPELAHLAHLAVQQQHLAILQQHHQQSRVEKPTLVGVIRMALMQGGRPPVGGGPGRGGQPARPVPGRMVGPTIYGRTDIDLAASLGPVPITFSVEAPMREVSRAGRGIPRQAMSLREGAAVPKESPATSPREASFREAASRAVEKAGVGSKVGNENEVYEEGGEGAEGQPRANFFPKIRPRSRSFSGFNSTDAEVALPVQENHAGVAQPLKLPPAKEIKRSISAMPSAASSTPSNSMSLSTRPALRSLSVGTGGLRPTANAPKVPTSPLAQSMVVPSPVTSPISTIPPSPTASSRPSQLRQVTSRATLDDGSSSYPQPSSRTTVLGSNFDDVSPLPSPSLISPFPAARIASLQAQTRDAGVSLPGSKSLSIDADTASVHSERSQLTSPPPTVLRQPSLRTKLSLPNLRRHRSRQEETASITALDAETLQVQDMDFELVRPSIQLQQAPRTSEDSGVFGRDLSTDVRQDFKPAFLRTDSPTVSISSGGAASGSRSPAADSPTLPSWKPASPNLPSRPTTDSESSMDAHRNREQKWMYIMTTVSPSQARKNKKVRKLLLDGVPSSVRYLVWSHLTDGKARVVPGVYAQFGSRGQVAASSDIERDIRLCFQDHPHLQVTQGPVLVLLQAYLTMVPDVHYTTGLTLIVGQLLLLAPEEDAFWIFVSIMDTHIRPYFSTSTAQMEVDSALFSRALEANDPAVGKKLLVEMGITPSSICLPWFSSLFVGILPPDYLNRVWDLFLFEGVPFLIRVGLAIVSCCRTQILESRSDEAVLALLQHLYPNLLPPTPDLFLQLALSFKLKDDDVRKQRIKMEAQVKRQTQVPRMASTHGSISLPRP